MDEDVTPTRPRRTSAMALLAAGTLSGVVLGLSTGAFAADDPSGTTGSTGGATSSTVQPVAPEDCPEGGRGPGGGAGAGTAPAPSVPAPTTSSSGAADL